MKSKTEKIPEFDEIIFRNRNKSYGAYLLRKRYKFTASLSVFFGVSIFVLLIVGLSLKSEKGIADDRPSIGIIVQVDPYIPEKVDPVDTKKPEEQLRQLLKNIAPVVTDDTLITDGYIPTAEELGMLDLNRDVADTADYVEVDIDPIIPVEPDPVVFVEEPPQFPGGEPALLRYVAENLKYPAIAIENNVQGRVFLKFVVNSDGSVDRIEVIKGVDPSLDAEAVRVIGTLPKFSPGKQNGVAVPVFFTIPVLFEIR